MAFVFLAIGFVIAIVGFIQFLVVAFKESVLWGLGCLFFWPASVAFLLNYWEDSKKAFGIHMAGNALMFLSMMFASGGSTV